MPHVLHAFGSNNHNQLGIPPSNQLGDKVKNPTLSGYPPQDEAIGSLSGGAQHTVFLTSKGNVYGAGNNVQGQMNVFQKLYSGIDFVAAGWTSTAYIVNPPMNDDHERHAKIYTEGTCRWGELGRGVQNDSTSMTNTGPNNTPLEITLPGRVISFAAGTHHYVAVTDDGSVYGWGKTRHGQLGDEPRPLLIPTKLPGTWPAQKVVCGHEFTYIVGAPDKGNQRIMGRDAFGIHNLPTDIQGWKDICATWHAVFILFNDGRLIAWGKNDFWQLIPPNLPLIDQIVTGPEHVLALTRDGRLISWGWGGDGNCGDLSVMTPPPVNDRVTGRFNTITGIPGRIITFGAGPNTSFVLSHLLDGEAEATELLAQPNVPL